MKFFRAAHIMKLTIILLIFFVLDVSAYGFGQKKLTLKYTNTEIASILTQIEKQTNYRFLYDNDQQELKRQISLDVRDADLRDVLDRVLSGTNLSYQFMENDLVVIKDTSSLANAINRGYRNGNG